MRFLLAIQTPNTLIGKSLSWITPPGNSMTLTQGPWKFSVLGWVEVNLMKIGTYCWLAKRKRMCMGHLSANRTIGMQELAQ